MRMIERENTEPEAIEGHPRLPTMKDYYQQNPRLPTMKDYYQQNPSTKHTADLHVQKTGLVYIQMSNCKRLPVRAKVYNNRLDHYILFSAKSLSNSNQKFVNLKHTHVEQEGDNSIRIIPNKDIEGQSILIEVSKKSDLPSWLEALTPLDISSPALLRRNPLMPTLQESDEE